MCRAPSSAAGGLLRRSLPGERRPAGAVGVPWFAERWEAARRGIVEAIDRPGTLLDVGCANGLLLESLVEWSPFPLEPFGVDFAPRLVELARRRLPRWADRLWVGDAATWVPQHRFDFVHVRYEIGFVERLLAFGGRLIVSSDGSWRRPDSPRSERVGERLRERGHAVGGECYRRSEKHQVELSVAWIEALPDPRRLVS